MLYSDILFEEKQWKNDTACACCKSEDVSLLAAHPAATEQFTWEFRNAAAFLLISLRKF